jgi:hypothetical protein
LRWFGRGDWRRASLVAVVAFAATGFRWLRLSLLWTFIVVEVWPSVLLGVAHLPDDLPFDMHAP